MMAVNNKILITFGLLLALSSYASAFFFSWGGEATTQPPLRYYYYHQKRLLQNPAPFYTQEPPPLAETANIQNIQQVPMPSIPVQVPLQANLGPSPIQNVQLVPCLCPVQQDYSMDGPMAMDNLYVNPQQSQEKKSRK